MTVRPHVQSMTEQIDAWDPLQEGDQDQGLLIAAQRREIRNILKSYTGYYDLLAEMFQNALDAVERRAREGHVDYRPTVWVRLDLSSSTVSVTDNGCGMSFSQFQQFMRPNFSFKDRVCLSTEKSAIRCGKIRPRPEC